MDESGHQLLLDAVVTMSADLSLDSVLSRIVAIASRLVDAEYAALGVLGANPIGDCARSSTTAWTLMRLP